MLVDFFSFLENLEGVDDLHFLIRDRIDDEVVFSFRVLTKPKMKKVVKSKIAYKLKRLTSEDKFAIDPDAENPLQKYVAWLKIHFKNMLLDRLKAELLNVDLKNSLPFTVYSVNSARLLWTWLRTNTSRLLKE
jgi:hypothetical protein